MALSGLSRRERQVMDLVLSVASDYARHLVEIASSLRWSSALESAAVAMARVRN